MFTAVLDENNMIRKDLKAACQAGRWSRDLRISSLLNGLSPSDGSSETTNSSHTHAASDK